MAMVKITNGETVSKVPYAAYETQYKKLGFHIVGESVESNTLEDTSKRAENTAPVEDVKEDVKDDEVSDEDVSDKEDEDDAFIDDILEKPLSQWSQDELKKFAEIKEIDTSKAKKVSEARAIIKKYLDEQEKAQV